MKIAECGTPSGYRRHRREHEDACEACLSATAAAQREWQEQRKGNAATKMARRCHVVTVRCCYCRREAQVSDASGKWVCGDGSLKFGSTPGLGPYLEQGWRCTANCEVRSGSEA